MEKHQPIGIFDSGIGGLSIGLALKQLLPSEDLVYFADTGFSPYGNKPNNVIAARSDQIVDFLLKQGCKLVVVACNTATVNTIARLRAQYSVPIVGVEPGVKPAAKTSKSKAIAVLATEQTLKSDAFAQLKARYSASVRIETVACPEFVSLVESLKHETDAAVRAAQRYIQPLLDKGCDQIILGCTHFSFLKQAILAVVGDQAEIIDTAIPVVKQVERQLKKYNLTRDFSQPGTTKFWTSGIKEELQRSIRYLWGQETEISFAMT